MVIAVDVVLDVVVVVEVVMEVVVVVIMEAEEAVVVLTVMLAASIVMEVIVWTSTQEMKQVWETKICIVYIRGVWGTLRSTSTVAVSNALKLVPEIPSGSIIVKRKYKTRPETAVM